eukprot:3623790-Rhodomonas_salina.2
MDLDDDGVLAGEGTAGDDALGWVPRDVGDEAAQMRHPLARDRGVLLACSRVDLRQLARCRTWRRARKSDALALFRERLWIFTPKTEHER